MGNFTGQFIQSVFIASLYSRHCSWQQRYTTDRWMSSSHSEDHRGKQRSTKQWDKCHKGLRSIPRVTSHSPPKNTWAHLKDREEGFFVSPEHRGTCHVSLDSHSELYPVRFEKTLQAVTQEGHTIEFIFLQRSLRAYERGPTSALLQKVRGKMPADGHKALSVRMKRETRFRL